MGGFEKFCWIVTILASLAAAAVLAAAVFAREFAAPQEAVLAAVGVGIAIVPYVFTRGIQALGRDARQRAAGRLLPAEPAPAAKAAPRETPPPLGVPQEPVPSQAEPPIELPAGEPAPEPPRGRVARERLFPRPRPAAPEDPAPSQAERSIELPAGEPSPEPPKGLVARERLVPPAPPPPRRSGLERAFWVLIGILMVIIVVGIILIRNGP